MIQLVWFTAGPAGRVQAQDAAGSALHFDGTTGFGEAANVPIADGESFTVECWMYRDAVPPGTVSPAVSKSPGSDWYFPGNGGWSLGIDNLGTPYFALHALDYPLYQGWDIVTPGRWIHVAGVYDATALTARLYLDGQLADEAPSRYANGNPRISLTRPQAANGDPVKVGLANGNFLAGGVDEVRIWNVARTASQISGARQSPLRGDETGLIAYWRCDDTSGGSVPDSSGHGRPLVLRGGTQATASAAKITSESHSVAIKSLGGTQAKGRAVITDTFGWIENIEMTDWGSGYSTWPKIRARSSDRFETIGTYYADRRSINFFSFSHWGDETVIAIEPPHMGDLQGAFDNLQVNEIELGPGIFFNTAVVTRNVTIRGAGMGVTTISGAYLGSVFEVFPGVTLTLEDLTIADGLNGSGGGIYNEGQVILNRVEVRDCRAISSLGGEGGGIYNRGAARLIAHDCRIHGNIAARNGGGISNSGFNSSNLTVNGGGRASDEFRGYTEDDLESIQPPGPVPSEADAEAADQQYAATTGARAARTGSASDFMRSQIAQPFNDTLAWLGLGSPVAEIHNTTFSDNKVGNGIVTARHLQMIYVGSTGYLYDFFVPRVICFGAGAHNDLGLLKLDGCTFTDNEAVALLGSSGGAISSIFGAVEVTGSTLSHNRVESTSILAMGGAIHTFGSYLRITDTVANDNTVSALFLSSGGALKNTVGSFAEIERCEMLGNTSGGGGAIANDYYGILQATDTTFRSNRVSGIISAYGGGIRNELGGQALLLRCTVSENSATGKAKGGGIYNECTGSSTILATTLQLRDSTVSLNTANGIGTFDIPLEAFGAGVYNGSFNRGLAVVGITSSTICSNSAVNGLTRSGGGLYSTALSTLKVSTSENVPGISTIGIENTLLAHNEPNDCFNRTISGSTAIVSEGHNMDSDGTGASETAISEALLPSGARFRTTANPRLGPLEFNGGRTVTHALLSGSPARDVGGFKEIGTDYWKLTDQRGVVRPTQAIDIGAYESAQPAAFADHYEVAEDRLLSVPARSGAMANDFADRPRVGLASLPAHGQVRFATDGSFDYLPAPRFNGTDQFDYVVTDEVGRASLATVSITVKASLNWLDMVPAELSQAETDAHIVLTFDEPVESAAVLAGVTVSGSKSRRRTFTVSVAGNVATLDIANLLARDEIVTVTTTTAMRSAVNSPFAVEESRQFRTFPNRPPSAAPAQSFAADKNRLLVVPASTLLNGATDPEQDALRVRTDVVIQDSIFNLLERFDAKSEDLFYVGNWPDGSWAVRLPVFASHGRLSLRADGGFTYQPDADFLGTDTFSYVVTDGEYDSAPTTITINVTGIPNAPVPQPDLYAFVPFELETASFVIEVPAPGVLGNDVNIHGAPMTAELVSSTSNGTLNFRADGSFSYRSQNIGLSGIDEFTYRVVSGAFVSGPIRVALGSRAVIATDDFYLAAGGAPLDIGSADGVLANDFDPNWNVPAIQTTWANLVQGPAHGTLRLNQDGSFTYQPDSGYTGADSFTYGVASFYGSEPTARVKLGNTPPIAAPDSLSVFAGVTSSFPANAGLLANDSDPDGDPQLTAELVTSPAQGTLTLRPDGSLTFTPVSGSVAPVTFTYRVSDGRNVSAPATVTIRIVEQLQVVAVEPTPQSSRFNATGAVQFTLSQPPEAATVAEHVRVFGAHSGGHNFTASVSGSQVTLQFAEPFLAGEKVSVSLTAGMKGGVQAELQQGFVWQFNTAATRGGSSFTRTVAPGSTSLFTRKAAVADFNGDGFPDVVGCNPGQFANVYMNNGDRTFASRQETLGMPYPGTLSDRFEPIVGDLNGDGRPDLVLNGEVDSAVIFNARETQLRVGLNNGDGTFTASVLSRSLGLPRELLDGDFDGDGDLDLFGFDGSKAWLWRNDGHGDFTEDTSTAVTIPLLADAIAGDLNGDGFLDVYLSGSSGDRILLNDGTGHFTAVATGLSKEFATANAAGDFDGNATLDIATGRNTSRIWLNDGQATMQRSAFELVQAPTLGLAVGDFNGDGLPDIWQANAQDAGGLNGGDGVWINGGSARFSRLGSLLGNSQSYNAVVADFDRDGDLDVFVANDSRTTNTGNEIWFNQSAPVAVADFYAANGPNPVSIAAPGVLSNDLAGDGGTMTASLVNGPLRGTVTLNATGGFIYTPGTGFAGADVFTYRVADSQGNSAPVQVKIGNTAPTAVADGTYSVAASETTTVNAAQGVLANDIETDGDPLRASLVNAPTRGIVSLATDGSFTYTPTAGYLGIDTFTYRVSDGRTDSAPATVSLDVRPRLALLSSTPADASVTAPRNTGIVLRFSASIVASTVPAHVHLDGSQSGRHVFQSAVNGSELRLTPASPFFAGERVAVTLLPGLEGASRAFLPRLARVEFTIEAPNGSGVFTVSQRIATPSLIIDGSGVFDAGNDGDPDLLAAGSGLLVPGSTLIWSNDGTGTVTPGTTPISTNSFGRVQMIDLDGDGHLDGVARQISPAGAIGLFINDSQGGFTLQARTLTGVIPVSELNDLRAADLNGDGLPDLVGYKSSAVWVWLNDGSGQFTEKADAFRYVNFANRVFSGLQLADLNGDGTVDLVLRQFSAATPTLVWFNDGTGVFADSGQALGTGGSALAVGDLNGDGAPDLIAPTSNSTNPFAWINDGAGHFTVSPTSYAFKTVASVAVADLNGDGAQDLVVAQSEFISPSSVNRTVILFNDGNGGLSAGSQRPGEDTTINRITTADLNGDGAIDLILNGGAAQVQLVCLNQATQPLPSGIAQSSITELETARPFEQVSLRLQGTATVSVTVTLDDAAKGRFLDTSLAGFVRAGASYSLDNVSASAAETALQSLVFAPTRHRSAVGSSEVTVFTLTVENGSSSRTDNRTTVSVAAVNTPPIGAEDSISTTATQPVNTANVLANDTDPNPGDTFTIVDLVTVGTIGQVTQTGPATFRYDPAGRFSLPAAAVATDSFVYVLEDSHGARTPVRVLVQVTGLNSPPVAPNVALDVRENSGANVLTAAILANVVDPDAGDTATLVAVDATGTLGAVQLDPLGNLVYNPNGTGPNLSPGAIRSDSFGYTVRDSSGTTASGRVAIRVVGLNDPPSARPVSLAVAETSTLPDIGARLLAAASDPDPNQTSTLRISRIIPTSTRGVAAIFNGIVQYSTAGKFDSLPAGQTATDRFDFEIVDVNGATVVGTATVTITGENTAPTAAPASLVRDYSNTPTNVTALLLANATDIDTPTTSLRVASLNTAGTLGTVTIANGTVTYTPPAAVRIPKGEFLPDTFRFAIADPAGATSPTAVATVYLRGVNSAPIAADDLATLDEASGAVDLTSLVLANDTDPDTGDKAALVISAVDTAGVRGLVTMNGGVLTYSPNAKFNNLGAGQSATESFTYTIRDPYGETATARITLTISGSNDAPTLAADPTSVSVQYSDVISPVVVTATDVDSAGTTLTAQTSWKTGSGAFAAGLPAGFTFGISTTAANARTWRLSGVANVAPGTYTIRVVATDGTASTAPLDIPVTVVPEDARVTFTGTLFASTSSSASGAATVLLGATVQDISAVPSDPSSDGSAGDIRNATITFVNRDNNTVIAARLPVSLVNASDLRTGSATYSWTVDIGAANSKSFTIGVIVEGRYARDSAVDSTVVTVTRPLTSRRAVGGGYIPVTRPAGLVPPDAGSRLYFGVGVIYSSAGKLLQGDSLATFASRGRCYEIRGESVLSFSGQSTRAVYTGKASVLDITAPLRPVLVETNATLRFSMTDNGDNGTLDTLSLDVWNKNGALWLSSDWDGTKTVERRLGAGNLVVRDGSNPKVAQRAGTTTGGTALTIETVQVVDPESGSYDAVRLRFAATPGEEYTIETTDDLNGWAPLQNVQAAGESVEYIDTTERTTRLYRVRRMSE